MKRRYFVGLLVGGAAALSGSWLLVFRDHDERVGTVIRLCEIFPDLDSVCSLGDLVSNSLPEKTTEQLLTALLSGPEWSAFSERNAGSILRRRIRGDFAEGNTVVVDDWTLSRTEALFYALTSRLCCGIRRLCPDLCRF